MKARNNAVVVLLFLTNCNQEAQQGSVSNIESARVALGVVPPSEVATWRKIGSTTTFPEGRYLQSAVFDETRKLLVMFGGTTTDNWGASSRPYQETWEWSSTTSKWTNRTKDGTKPDPRSGAGMVFDAARNKLVLFGGRSASGLNFEDTWEWDPTSGDWTKVSTSGNHPRARSQHAMVFEKSTGKILLFGGGSSNSLSYDAAGITVSLGDTWEYDAAHATWTQLTVTPSPVARHDAGMVWDAKRSKVVLFAGESIENAGDVPAPKQDLWEWDPEAQKWSTRAVPGTKPSPRNGHAMAFDASRNKVVVFGGSNLDETQLGGLNDLWDWEPTDGKWTERLTGAEKGTPSGRRFSSMVFDTSAAHLLLVAGYAEYVANSSGYPTILPSRDVWELDPATSVFTNRNPPLDQPSPRFYSTSAFNATTNRVYLFGGLDAYNSEQLNDLWEWDGQTWKEVVMDKRPPGMYSARLAYDPARKSLILYCGTNGQDSLDETWEWTSDKKWTKLKTTGSPGAPLFPGMVTDTTRNRILLFGGLASVQSGAPIQPINNNVWEWDGATSTWTNRTPVPPLVPAGQQYPHLAYDEGRQKMVYYDKNNSGALWEWDPISAGWEHRDTGDSPTFGYNNPLITYDSNRRRLILFPNLFSRSGSSPMWEIDGTGPTLYVRTMTNSPQVINTDAMVFDQARGVTLLLGGLNYGSSDTETWEYKVTNWGNGEGCNATVASSCASGFCVDGVCCEVASCTGACKSCNTPGAEGTCVLAKAGTEVPGSCSAKQACDGNGACKTKNGESCTGAATCASGFCADGVCCDSACTGPCVSCNQTGQAGKCRPYASGTDPQSECVGGTGVCKSTCNGAGSCAFPQYTVSCGDCMSCDGKGACQDSDPDNPLCYSGISGGGGSSRGGSGGATPSTGGVGGSSVGAGGIGGISAGKGGSGGSATGGVGGGIPDAGIDDSGTSKAGAGGSSTGNVGSGGSVGGISDAGSNKVSVKRTGCNCQLGQTERVRPLPGAPILIVGTALLLVRRRRRRAGSAMDALAKSMGSVRWSGMSAMRSGSLGLVALFLLATCAEQARQGNSADLEPAKVALGVVPPSEVATWKKIASSASPEGRCLQAVAFDETRKVLVMFGGVDTDYSYPRSFKPNQETWEWNPTSGKWASRTGAGTKPDPRWGAGLVFDSARSKFLLFGGRSADGTDFEDTWEWDPTSGDWSKISTSGSLPKARSQHSMVFEKSTKKTLLFGGGSSDAQSSYASQMVVSLGDTWEYDSASKTWTSRAATVSPVVRHGSGMVWDSTRSKVVLFAGISVDIKGTAGIPKQDVWEWDPEAHTWSEMAVRGGPPSQRYGHAMAFDDGSNKVVVFGGSDINDANGGSLNDLWELDAGNAVWTQRLLGSKSGTPSNRRFSSMVFDPSRARLWIVAGWADTNAASRDVWELDPATLAFTDRTAAQDYPTGRSQAVMAFNPATGKTYLFGGSEPLTENLLNDLWEWDGQAWKEVVMEIRPPARIHAALAYDPARKSLILYGGDNESVSSTSYDETWEWTSDKKWTLLETKGSPGGYSNSGMVSDTTRGKILLFGGIRGLSVGPANNSVWEWDGTSMTWTNRTPVPPAQLGGWERPPIAYDEGRQKLYLSDVPQSEAFWEWDPISAGWELRDTRESLLSSFATGPVAYDSIRRRIVILPNHEGAGPLETWELATRAPTLYVRTTPDAPIVSEFPSMVFDSGRGVAVLYKNNGYLNNEIWEYKVTKWGNGEGCNAAFASSCISGFCVEGVCCEAASCTGTCKSCNVAGSEGTCVLAKAGAEVPGSCSASQACDGKGNCTTKNGEPCTSAASCASGFCADGVCCDSSCTGACAACNQTGQVGKCKPYTAGTDPQNECGGKGSGECKSTCNGAGSCVFPEATVSCGECMTCDGKGSCQHFDPADPFCGSYGGSGGSSRGHGGSGGSSSSRGGAAGSMVNTGGSGGHVSNGGGNGGYSNGGNGGSVPGEGGNGGRSDGGVGDAGKASLGKSGCHCGLGRAQQGPSGLGMTFLVASIALLLARKRR